MRDKLERRDPSPPELQKRHAGVYQPGFGISVMGTSSCVLLFLMRETIALQRAAANWMVYCNPSMIHPRSSFVVSHVLSPWFIFRCDMGSSPWSFVNSGGGRPNGSPQLVLLRIFLGVAVINYLSKHRSHRQILLVDLR